MKNKLLDATGIKKSFGNLDVLKGIDIHVDEAEIVAIMGKSGSGKSTLLQILGTLDSPDEGELIIDQKVVSSFNNNEIAKFRNKNIDII